MDAVTINPYSPPAGTEDPARQGSWRVEGPHLLVREGTVLPTVDLEGGAAGAVLTPVLIKLSGMVPASGGEPARAAVARGYASVPALRARARRGKWRNRLLWGSIVCIWLPLPGDGANSMEPAELMKEAAVMLWAFLPMLGILAAWVWGISDRGVKCVRSKDGWHHLAGVHFAALAELARRGHEPPPVPRLRKAYRLFGYRLPLAALVMVRQKWNPFIWMLMALLKAMKSPMLAQRYLHWSERGTAAASRTDPDLRERWKKSAAGTVLETWTVRWSDCRDSPIAGVRALTLVTASPDGRFFATLHVVRASMAGSFEEAEELNFLSWTAEGQLLDTSAFRAIEPLPANREFVRIKAAPAKVWAAHHERAGELAVALRDDADLRRRLDQAEVDREVTLEAAGVCGPVEEIELSWGEEAFPGPPPLPGPA